MLHQQLYDVARLFAKETNSELFSDISLYLETNKIVDKLKVATEASTEINPENSGIVSEGLDLCLAWCNTYKTKL